MPRWSNAELVAYETRRAPQRRFDEDGESVGYESDLHDQIIAECRRREWPYVHSRMDKASTIGVGVADFIILRHGGSPLIIECKRKGSKATPAQLGFIAHCRKNGYTAEIVYSFEEFLCLLTNNTSPPATPAPAQPNSAKSSTSPSTPKP